MDLVVEHVEVTVQKIKVLNIISNHIATNHARESSYDLSESNYQLEHNEKVVAISLKA